MMQSIPLLLSLFGWILIWIPISEPVGILSESQYFCYTDPECGPDSDKWNGECHNGTHQSPINLIRESWQTHHEYFPLHHLHAKKFFINNNGHTLNVDFAATGVSIFPGNGLSDIRYLFSNAHLHWSDTNGKGSEHQLNGKSFSAELHLVHYKEKYGTLQNAINSKDPNGLAVIGVFLQVNESATTSNPALKPIVKNLEKVREGSQCWMKIDEPIDFTSLLPNNDIIYSYKGSLTTPPCNEQVHWYIFEKSAFISPADIQAFRKLADKNGDPILDNHRPVQKRNSRKIDLIRPIPI